MSKAFLSICDFYKEGGVGVVLEVETISAGIVKAGFQYIIEGLGVLQIKTFENNFLPLEYEHPSSGILVLVSLNFNYKNLKKDMILCPLDSQ